MEGSAQSVFDRDSRCGDGDRDLGWDNSVVGHYLREDTAGGLDTESQGTDVDEENLVSALLAGDDTTLETSTSNDGLVGVDSLRRFLAVEGVLEEQLNLEDTNGATNEDDVVGVFRPSTPARSACY